MEGLMQKHIKYFYMTLLIIILIQFVGTIIETITGGFLCGTIISMMLFLINVILLTDAIKHNIKQQFTECKEDARILRFTLALLAIFRMVSCTCSDSFDWIRLTDYVMIIGVIETVLAHRIKSIEYLENLSSKINKSRTPDQKGEE
jgi:putative effector of murein hydrolase LrgA (UPF0299 family)